MSVWTVSANEIRRLQGNDPEMTAILNQLLAEATAGTLPPSALLLNLKTHVPDGGIDAAVDGSLPPERDTMGLFADRTGWQYKACPTGHIKPPRDETGGQETALRLELQKPEARRLIVQGYGYRFCITDCLTPEKRQQWETWLLDEARKINSLAPPVKVIGADLLADWCSRYPGLVRRLRPFLSAVHDFRTWERQESVEAPTFVPVPSRQVVAQAVRQFADLAQPVRVPVLTISGEAGVGKTRCLLEALRTVPGIEALLVATPDERAATDLIHRLLNEPDYRAIFVIDGMSVAARTQLARALTADAGRLRVIVIDNERQEDLAPEGEYRLGPLERVDVEKILAENFPTISSEQRWAIAALAGGFVRVAVDICRCIHLLPQRGDLAPVVLQIRDDYLASRLTLEQRRVVELVSLLARVGYRGTLADELRALCAACPAAQLTAEQVIAVASDIRRTPGFIAAGPRYLYVTPPVIAQAAFRSAWHRWVEPDPDTFFILLPSALEDALARQLRDAGTEDMRRVFTSYHASWLERLCTTDLANPAIMTRLLRAAEVEPETTLPPLARLICEATADQIRGLDRLPIQRHAPGAVWAARRELVCLAEWMLRFPEFYCFAECILFRLALVETESCGNNATAIWCQSYRPYLSGTPIPFTCRLAQLEQRLTAAGDEAEIRLCLRVLEGVLDADHPAFRSGSPALISGRMPPPDWIPATQEELAAVWPATAAMVARNAGNPNLAVAEGVVGVTIQHAFGLIHHGHLGEVIRVAESRPVSPARLVEVLHVIERFLTLYCNPDRGNVPADLDRELRAWRERLQPTSLLQRVQMILRQSLHDIYLNHADRGEGLFFGLAQELMSDTSTLAAVLPWSFSQEAVSSHALGMALGKLDESAGLLDRLAEIATGQANVALLRGYLVGLLERHPVHANRVCQLLDRLADSQPHLAFTLLLTGLPILCPLERTFAIVDAGRIHASCLREVWHLVGVRALTATELTDILTRLLPGMQAGDAASGQAALAVLTQHLHGLRQAGQSLPVFDSQPLSLVRTVLETTLTLDLGQEAWEWDEVLAALGHSDPACAIRLAVSALASENHRWIPDHTERFLATLAPHHPQTVMDEIGRSLLDTAAGWRFRLRDLKPAIAALPVSIPRAWVEQHGVAGARVLAQLLPVPSIQENVPTVAALTEYVLDRFGDDERVFRAFCQGAAFHEGGWGDIARAYEQNAQRARQFLTHRCRWIQEWARRAERNARAHAERFRTDDEEFETP